MFGPEYRYLERSTGSPQIISMVPATAQPFQPPSDSTITVLRRVPSCNQALNHGGGLSLIVPVVTSIPSVGQLALNTLQYVVCFFVSHEAQPRLEQQLVLKHGHDRFNGHLMS